MLEWKKTEMANVATERFEIGGLLAQAGARLRGRNRADCPRCKRFRAISFTPETFFCHGIDCGWKGNTITLARELGTDIGKPSPEEIRRQKMARGAALKLYEAVRERRMMLQRELRSIGRAEIIADAAGPDDETAWRLLAACYELKPIIEAKLDFLETANAAELAENYGLLHFAAEKSAQVGSGCVGARC
jgi:hypothetical protein